jgi:hypothetical protein
VDVVDHFTQRHNKDPNRVVLNNTEGKSGIGAAALEYPVAGIVDENAETFRVGCKKCGTGFLLHEPVLRIGADAQRAGRVHEITVRLNRAFTGSVASVDGRIHFTFPSAVPLSEIVSIVPTSALRSF